MLFTDPTLVSDFKTEIADISERMSQQQARLLVILNQLQRAGVAGDDGARSMVDWTSNAWTSPSKPLAGWLMRQIGCTEPTPICLSSSPSILPIRQAAAG